MGKIEAEGEAERRRLAEVERIKRETEMAEARRIENEAPKELNEERAAEIAEKGQDKVDGLPELTGTPSRSRTPSTSAPPTPPSIQPTLL
jgi:hypothetical protein